MTNSMLVFATDNSTVEQAVYKGSSNSPLLLDMVIEYFELQVIFNFTILITHVAGKRMIACGSDGLSRGATNEGIMNGEDFLSFLPLHLSAIDRSSDLKNWVLDWTKRSKVIFLSPEDCLSEVMILPVETTIRIINLTDDGGRK